MWNDLLVCGVAASEQMQEMETPLLGIWFIWSAARQISFCLQRGRRTRKKSMRKADELFIMSRNGNILFTTCLFDLVEICILPHFYKPSQVTESLCSITAQMILRNTFKHDFLNIFSVQTVSLSPLWAVFDIGCDPFVDNTNQRCNTAPICQTPLLWIFQKLMPPMRADLCSLPDTPDSSWRICKKTDWFTNNAKEVPFICLSDDGGLVCVAGSVWRHVRHGLTAVGGGSKSSSSEAFQVHWMVSSLENSTVSLQACVAGTQ